MAGMNQPFYVVYIYIYIYTTNVYSYHQYVHILKSNLHTLHVVKLAIRCTQQRSKSASASPFAGRSAVQASTNGSWPAEIWVWLDWFKGNFTGKPWIFPLHMGLSCKFSLKPIHWEWIAPSNRGLVLETHRQPSPAQGKVNTATTRCLQHVWSGWWCNNHLEKYESQWEGWQPIYEMENKIHVPNHQPPTSI